MKEQNLNGALTGLAVSAAVYWARYDDDTQRRLRNVRLDAEQALALIRDLQSRGEMLRGRLPSVMDAQVGLALANPAPVSAEVIPNAAPRTRPDVFQSMQVAVADMTWPPEPGVYDDKGLVRQTGELTQLFLCLTYEEVRAFIQGLAQSKQPDADCKIQTFFAANALVSQLCEQKLSWADYKTAWKRLFTGLGSTTTTTTTTTNSQVPSDQVNHGMSSAILSPKASALGPNVASVVPLTAPLVPYDNPQTDLVSRWRLGVGANNLVAGQAVCTITFGTPFRWLKPLGDGNSALTPYQPGVSIESPNNVLYADQISDSTFVVKTNQAIGANSVMDLTVKAASGFVAEK